jgi:hypothetical protein
MRRSVGLAAATELELMARRKARREERILILLIGIR